MSSYDTRKKISKDTLARIPAILHEVREGSPDSTFISEQLPPLPREKCPNHPPINIRVVNSDAFTVAREMIKASNGEAKGKITVLNLASDLEPAGGWAVTLSRTQEEALCYSSTLYSTLKEQYYPWPNLGKGSVAGIYSPAVVIFKDDLDHECVDLDPSERRVVSVITVAAPRAPDLSNGKFRPQTLHYMREKIRLVYRIAAHNGQQYIVLGAMGCGVYHCPPKQVAEEMKAVLLENEFKGWFCEIVFAVYATARNSNFDIFKETLDGMKVNTDQPLSPTLAHTFIRRIKNLMSRS